MSITLGPLAIALPHLVLLAGLVVAAVTAWRMRRRYPQTGQSALWAAVLLGLLVARGVYVAANWQYYGARILEIPQVWEGGFEPVSGVAALLLTALLLNRGRRPWRPLWLPMAAGLLTWGMLSWFSQALNPASGQPLPDLALQSLDGKPVRLSEYRGRPVVINLWAVWCPPCRSEMPALALLEKKHQGTAFLYINQGEDQETIAGYLAEEDLALSNVIRDPFNAAWQRFEAAAIPTTLFYDAEGRLVDRHTGELSYPQLQGILGRLQ